MTTSTQQPKSMHLQSEQLAAPAEGLTPNLDTVPQRIREIAMLRGL